MTTKDEAEARVPDTPAQHRSVEMAQRILMTLRVSRDSGRTWGRVTEVREVEEPVFLDNPGLFPACMCPRCTNRSPRFGVSSRAGS